MRADERRRELPIEVTSSMCFGCSEGGGCACELRFVEEKRADDTVRAHEGAVVALRALGQIPLWDLERERERKGERGKRRK